jgi:hypothetical protein
MQFQLIGIDNQYETKNPKNKNNPEKNTFKKILHLTNLMN